MWIALHQAPNPHHSDSSVNFHVDTLVSRSESKEDLMKLSSTPGCVQCLPSRSQTSVRTCAHCRQRITALARRETETVGKEFQCLCCEGCQPHPSLGSTAYNKLSHLPMFFNQRDPKTARKAGLGGQGHCHCDCQPHALEND